MADIVARYKGGKSGEYHPGIPARSLDEDDMKALTPDERALVKGSDLYEMVEADKAPAKHVETGGGKA